jgi:hypothetical protein
VVGVLVWVCFDILLVCYTGWVVLFMCFVLSFKKISIFWSAPVGSTSNNTPNWQNLTFCVWAIFQVAQSGPLEKHFGHETDCFMTKQFFGTHSTSVCQTTL